MRFMIIRRADAATEAGAIPSTALFAAMHDYMGRMAKAGVLREGEGLLASAKGARLSFQGGQPMVTRGPFGNTTDMMAGFVLVDVAGLDEAIDWARQWPPLDGDGVVQLEIRQIAEAGDFGEALTPELRDAEDTMRDQIGR